MNIVKLLHLKQVKVQLIALIVVLIFKIKYICSMKILVVDIETTGLYTNSDAIVEIGISLVDTNTKKVTLLFDKIVKDKILTKWKHQNGWVFNNSDLTYEEVENAEPIEHYFDEIQSYFDKYKMTAYNKSFDLRFLRRAGFKINDIKCLMKTATQYSILKDKLGRVKKPSVEEIYNQFFIKEGDAYIEKHRAGADVLDESRILLHMVDLKKK